MSEKLSDLTLNDIRAALAKEVRDIAIFKAELEFSESKVKLLEAEFDKRLNTGDKANG